MSNVYFTSDLHLGHKNVGKWRKFADSCEENTAVIAEHWFSTINKRDVIYVLGDACFDRQGLDSLGAMPGRKILVRGNHDYLTTQEYLEVFEEVHGILSYRAKGVRAWFSHAPVHPQELRGRRNIHGHVHYNPIMEGYSLDNRYINVCCDYLLQERGRIFMDLREIRNHISET